MWQWRDHLSEPQAQRALNGDATIAKVGAVEALLAKVFAASVLVVAGWRPRWIFVRVLSPGLTPQA